MKYIFIVILINLLDSNTFAEDTKVSAEIQTSGFASTGKKFTLDPNILLDNEPKEIDTLFKNMIVVQRKVFERKNKWVLDTHLSFDFSDNPKTMYCAVFGVGYAFLESFEFGISVAPLFLANERASVAAVRNLTLANNQRADLYAPDPKLETMASLTWIFAYGKDAFGPYSIIRSDTFLKFFGSKVSYKDGFDGNRYGLSVGKTFFISPGLNFRFSAGFSRQISHINNISQATNIGLIEPGLVWFL